MSAAASAPSALGQAWPQLRRIVRAADALGLAPRQLLHAGPPLRDPCRPPAVLQSAAVMTALHEGWAASAADAEALIARGAISLSPAQARGCVVPLACVVSAGTPLLHVGECDAAVRATPVFAPLSALLGPDTRMGQRDLALLGRLADRDRRVAPALQALLAAHGPLDLLPLARSGLAHGDDLHSRTAAANAALVAALAARGADARLLADLAATPLFFLTLWMAASAAMLRRAEVAVEGAAGPLVSSLPTLVSRAGGNGERFGIALAGAPGDWVCCDADAPQGRLLPGAVGQLISGAIGDSAVIDLLGCGGLALAGAPEPLAAFDGFVPPDHATLAARLLSQPHAGLGRPIGVDAARVVAEQAPPLIALALLCADGAGGFAGRGLYRPPLALFERALAALQAGPDHTRATP